VKIYTHFDEIAHIPNPVLTIGTFDGVHVGHQKIIEQLNRRAEEVGGESVLFTFFPHPRMVIHPENHGIKLIQTQEEKIEKLARLGLKHLIVFPFTKEFSELTAKEFVCNFLVESLHVNTIIVGYDHQFGKNREGDLAFLESHAKENKFTVQEISAQEINDVNISSSKIRTALLKGDVRTANFYLNDAFELRGTVVHGNKLGRTIGYPTANIEIDDSLKLVPGNGVYAVRVILENKQEHLGMMNIGTRPTINDELTTHVEVHLFDFSETIYNQKIHVYLIEHVREEKKFSSVDELKLQLVHDETFVRTFFSN
jgi:riboflavin kinase / FMN adenylyltransferase